MKMNKTDLNRHIDMIKKEVEEYSINSPLISLSWKFPVLFFAMLIRISHLLDLFYYNWTIAHIQRINFLLRCRLQKNRNLFKNKFLFFILNFIFTFIFHIFQKQLYHIEKKNMKQKKEDCLYKNWMS